MAEKMKRIEIVKIEECDILIQDEATEILFDGNIPQEESIVVASRPATDNEKDDLIISVVTDYQCVTCHRIFQSEDMLLKHVDMCREEDDSINIMGLDNTTNYDSEEEEEDEDPLSLNLSAEDSDSKSQKNNNEKPIIKPVPETQCHCCAEDLKTAHSGGQFKCSNCDLSFKNKASLERHVIVIHWKCDSCTCNECGSSFRDKKALNKHRYTTHEDRKIFRCEPCDTYFSRSYHLNRHIMQSGCHGSIRNTFNCQVCKKDFTRKDNLREHLRTHAGTPQRQKKKCKYCPKEFFTNQQLLVHERMHTGERPVQCDLCPKTFLSSLALKKHRRVHTGEKPFECKYCQRKFAARETLNRHQRTHTGEKPHVCQYCGKSFIQAAQLRAHVFHHTGENGFYCDVCGKAFNRKARLNIHKKFVHEGAIPFTCEVCDKGFTRREDLVKHKQLHTGLKPFECNKCQKAFSAKSSLQAHLNTHRREPPQSCVECNRVFIRQDCLMRHIRAKHRELLEDVMNEVEKKHLQTQLFKIASIADAKTKTGESKRLSTDELLKAIIDLLRILIDEETLQLFGWPEAPIQDILEAVIRRCGHDPVTSESNVMFTDRLRQNIKLLFTVVVDMVNDETVKSLLTMKTVDDVILHILEISNQKRGLQPTSDCQCSGLRFAGQESFSCTIIEDYRGGKRQVPEGTRGHASDFTPARTERRVRNAPFPARNGNLPPSPSARAPSRVPLVGGGHVAPRYRAAFRYALCALIRGPNVVVDDARVCARSQRDVKSVLLRRCYGIYALSSGAYAIVGSASDSRPSSPALQLRKSHTAGQTPASPGLSIRLKAAVDSPFRFRRQPRSSVAGIPRRRQESSPRGRGRLSIRHLVSSSI